MERIYALSHRGNYVPRRRFVYLESAQRAALMVCRFLGLTDVIKDTVQIVNIHTGLVVEEYTVRLRKDRLVIEVEEVSQ